MNSCLGRGGSETSSQQEKSLTEYEVILKLTVQDVASLWRAAAQQLYSGGLESDDVDETIGPIDDPVINDCLATLTLPKAVEGCDLVDFDVHLGSRPGRLFGADDRPAAVRPALDVPWGGGRILGRHTSASA